MLGVGASPLIGQAERGYLEVNFDPSKAPKQLHLDGKMLGRQERLVTLLQSPGEWLQVCKAERADREIWAEEKEFAKARGIKRTQKR